MKITLKEIPIRDLVENYQDSGESGVTGYDGRLNIRPKYQREFVYGQKERDAVIDTVTKGFPLNVMYWVVAGPDAFEVLDGQQRTVSICQYVEGDFSVPDGKGNPTYFYNLLPDQQEALLDYKLMVYHCEGSESEQLDWFRTINIAGLTLTDQELRNAVRTGPWLTHAKSIFSRTNAAGVLLSSDYVSGAANRQAVLERALDWKSHGKIEDYMALHQHDQNANELWTYFQAVIAWVKATFPNYRSPMKTVNWGRLYDKFKDEHYDTDALETRIKALLIDDDVNSRYGIWSYVLDGDERHLSLRQFSDGQKLAAHERQNGLCAFGKKCKTPNNKDGKRVFTIAEMQADHITPWSKGGPTTADNCQMLCQPCNRDKSDH